MKKAAILAAFVFVWACAAPPPVRAQGQQKKRAQLTTQASTCGLADSTGYVELQVGNGMGAATFTLAGTWSGTISFFASGDGGATWNAVNVTPSNSTTAVTTATANGVWQLNPAAYTHICAAFTTATSGNVAATIQLSTASARSGGGGGGGGGGSSPGTSFNVTAAPYNAVADGSTNNSSAIAAVFTASNAISSGIPTVYFPCQTGKQCQYNYTDAGSTSPINPTIPTTIQCDPGVILNDTGTAHMIDIGNGTSSYLLPFRVTGCQFKGASITAANYINAGTGTTYNESGSIDHNIFFDLPSGSTAITGQGHIYNWLFDDNQFGVDNGTAGSFLNIGSLSDTDNQVTAHHNLIYCAGGVPVSVVNCTSAGVGILVGGIGSMVTDNFIVTMNPDVQVTQYGLQSHITGNNMENAPFGTHAAILYGQSGDASSTVVSGVVVDNNFTYVHTAAPWIAPASANDLAINWDVHDNKSPSGAAPTSVIKENSLAGQTGNIASANQCGSGPCLNTTGLVSGNVITPEPWLNLSSETYGDTFHRANGNLVAPWTVPNTGGPFAITSNVATCTTTCVEFYSNDISVNQTNGVQFGTAPTGTDEAGVYTRFTQIASASDSYYGCFYISGTGIQMYAATGAATQLGSTYTTVTPVAGDAIFMESIGASQTCYLRHAGVLTAIIGPIADATVTAGYGAMVIVGTTGTISLFTEKGTP